MVTVTTNATTRFCNCVEDRIMRRESEKLSKDPLSDPKKYHFKSKKFNFLNFIVGVCGERGKRQRKFDEFAS